MGADSTGTESTTGTDCQCDSTGRRLLSKSQHVAARQLQSEMELHYTVVADDTVMTSVSAVATADDAQTALSISMTAAANAASVSLGEITTFTAPSTPASYTVPVPVPSPSPASDTDNSGATLAGMSLLGMSLVAGSIIV